MLEPVISTPMLNPMHPPLAKQLIALSIRGFGDDPLGWRYPAVLFGSLTIVAMYFCGLALFGAQEPAILPSSRFGPSRLPDAARVKTELRLVSLAARWAPEPLEFGLPEFAGRISLQRSRGQLSPRPAALR